MASFATESVFRSTLGLALHNDDGILRVGEPRNREATSNEQTKRSD
jgi:hypothetical protein